MRHRILVADDDESARTGLAELLSTWGYEVEQAIDGKDALERAPAFGPTVVIADLVMPGLDGVALLKPLAELNPNTAVILLTGHATVETAVSAMREGAYDYLTKPVDSRRLRVLLDKAVERGEMLREVTLLRRQLKESLGIGPILGASPPMQEVYIPETLMESELFGHEKGAFTGAHERKAGYFELADTGTIFLDEITEMSPALQVKYLRILQDGVVRRIGGKTELKVDVRIMAATNRDALQAVKDKAFREDLYYRINVLAISMPPLRRRVEDLPLLVESFVAEFNQKYDRHVKSVDETAMMRLREHAWPGNVRELRNIIERAVVGCNEDLVTPTLLPLGLAPAERREQGDGVLLPLGTTLEQGERELILRTLESVNNNKTRAAAILGTTPKTLHNKTRRWRAGGDK